MKHPLNTTKSITLIELIISLVVVAIMVLSFYGLETFSHGQMINSERRAKVQNQLAYVLEHMNKYVQQANGDRNNPPIKYYPNAGPRTGFQVRFDCQATQTPSNLNDDVWIYYTLSGNDLRAGCSGGCGSCDRSVPIPPEVLSSKIVANFNNNILPVNPKDGFYVVVDPLGNFVDVGLVGRYDVSSPSALSNPQVEMKSKIICNSSSVN